MMFLNREFILTSFLAWKLHFDGHGKGNFTGERQPTKATELQQYYFSLQKRAEELLK